MINNDPKQRPTASMAISFFEGIKCQILNGIKNIKCQSKLKGLKKTPLKTKNEYTDVIKNILEVVQTTSMEQFIINTNPNPKNKGDIERAYTVVERTQLIWKDYKELIDNGTDYFTP